METHHYKQRKIFVSMEPGSPLVKKLILRDQVSLWSDIGVQYLESVTTTYCFAKTYYESSSLLPCIRQKKVLFDRYRRLLELSCIFWAFDMCALRVDSSWVMKHMPIWTNNLKMKKWVRFYFCHTALNKCRLLNVVFRFRVVNCLGLIRIYVDYCFQLFLSCTAWIIKRMSALFSSIRDNFGIMC